MGRQGQGEGRGGESKGKGDKGKQMVKGGVVVWKTLMQKERLQNMTPGL